MSLPSFVRGQKEVAVLLMQNGIDASVKNAKGQTALEMARDAQMKQLLEMQPIKQLQKSVQRFEGRLLKVCAPHENSSQQGQTPSVQLAGSHFYQSMCLFCVGETNAVFSEVQVDGLETVLGGARTRYPQFLSEPS